MAQEELNRFVKAVQNSKPLQSELRTAETPEHIARVAIKHRYQVTAQDLRESLAQCAQDAEGELSDVDLESVGGGAGLDGISYLIAVTQMKANNANDAALTDGGTPPAKKRATRRHA